MKSITLLNLDKSEELENISNLLRKHGSIYVYYIREDKENLTLKVIQKKNFLENYLSENDLRHRVKETFKDFTNKTLRIGVTPYSHPTVDVVTPEWIKLKMHKTKTPLKRIVSDFGVSKSDLSAVINGKKPLGQRTKAAFYFYFKSLGSLPY